uniref:Uncharacterized protein n=1 Tax=Vitis vinifera TaxID=29760 RepID=A5B961_VITVI|nr:hypothetical protein VITISV_026122 [Vitis vinifera]
MTRIRGGHTDPSVSREARLRASAPQDSFQAPQAPTVPSFEGVVLSSPPQHRYSTRRPPTSPPPEPSIHCIPPKRARARPFHYELYFDIKAMRQQPELRDSFKLFQRYHLERLMTPKEFSYPRAAIDFY